MKIRIIDISDPSRVSAKPTDVRVLFESKEFEQEGFSVTHVELRHYLERNDKDLGPYSLITSYVETDKGSVETVYDEGFRGDDDLNRTVTFLVTNLGISGLILRSLITLREHLDENSHNTC